MNTKIFSRIALIGILLSLVFAFWSVSFYSVVAPANGATLPNQNTYTESVIEPTESTKPTEPKETIPVPEAPKAESFEPGDTKEPEPIVKLPLLTEPTEPTEPEIVGTEYVIPEHYGQRDFKSYESWRAITSEASPHYELQNEYAYTGEDGIRMVEGRYCIALGSYFTTIIGQYVDVVLENGTVIECILGDQKADAHTDEPHIAHLTDGSIVEFIVDKEEIASLPRKLGNMSYAYEHWHSPVSKIIVYDKNFFENPKDAW